MKRLLLQQLVKSKWKWRNFIIASKPAKLRKRCKLKRIRKEKRDKNGKAYELACHCQAPVLLYWFSFTVTPPEEPAMLTKSIIDWLLSNAERTEMSFLTLVTQLNGRVKVLWLLSSDNLTSVPNLCFPLRLSICMLVCLHVCLFLFFICSFCFCWFVCLFFSLGKSTIIKTFLFGLKDFFPLANFIIIIIYPFSLHEEWGHWFSPSNTPCLWTLPPHT